MFNPNFNVFDSKQLQQVVEGNFNFAIQLQNQMNQSMIQSWGVYKEAVDKQISIASENQELLQKKLKGLFQN